MYLQQLCHDNLVNMIEVFRQRKRFYLVFEYLDHTLLDELERIGNGLGWEVSRRYVYQILRGLSFCHSRNVMHRDIKPENILVSPNGVIKLCDFGFARFTNGVNESCTDYVATRWYRAPELLVGDARYGKAVDVWAVGCVYAELVTGDALFPGESDVDQLYRITKVLGRLCTKHQTIISPGRSSQMLRHASTDELVGPTHSSVVSIRKLFPTWNSMTVDFLSQCLRMDPETRATSVALLQHPLFTQSNFVDEFLEQLRNIIADEAAMNPLTTKKLEKRRSTMFNLTSRNILHRWHMEVVSQDTKSNDRTATETIETTQLHQTPLLLHVDRLQKVLHFDPISVLPNATYVRKLNGFVSTNEYTHTLPSPDFKQFCSYTSINDKGENSRQRKTRKTRFHHFINNKKASIRRFT
ncbi:cyclin-dependent kinase-like 4 isoform X2 [Bombus vosnesenskii]|uniref:Cyclin-dependent kinase-like 4 isoform X2 n=1 Tax=Bombus vosnesenskii TaxID=207650 RepID=A0A6J3LCQ9_9HYME|nr:cyclin-dependent kinase-like 4 isoform X2 [Bombus vosnesenskii]XP_033363383.1 cyclin-dependent kinase-like 4 isoform X2 [Bombus vosnesenskii]XP_033363394.1 cyclin-dependent kinase-like 4 isoform X2 [Bombus vosnesenskii]